MAPMPEPTFFVSLSSLSSIIYSKRFCGSDLANLKIIDVVFKTRAAVFYRESKTTSRVQPSGFRPHKTRAASYLNGFKNIPGKACVKRVQNNDAFVNVGN